MDPNRLAESCIKHALPMQAVRMALREFHANLLADGPGATVGVHEFGVFYVHRNKERFVIREQTVYQVAERDVIKLRPVSVDANELTESPDVRVAFETTGDVEESYAFQSTSTTGKFVASSPSAIVDDVWQLSSHKWNGLRTYVFADTALTEAQMANTDGVAVSPAGHVDALRFDGSLLSVLRRATPDDVAIGFPTWQAEVDDGTLEPLGSATYGNEVSAHIRARAFAL